jgi:predicted phage terminase large subunit-like protein
MKNLDVPFDKGAIVTVCRKSRPELTRPGGLVRESQEMYKAFSGDFNKTELKWTFDKTGGGEIQFLGVDKDSLGSLQGMASSRTIIDEVGDGWDEETVLFLLSRTRSAKAKHKAQLIMTCNPDPNSFLVNWLDYCLDKETGVPIEGTKDIVRWFCVLDGKTLWADSAEECYEKHGRKRGMIFGLGMEEQEMLRVPANLLFLPKSFRFIPCGVYQNPYLLPPRNLTYLANLLAQSKKNQLKYLLGSWKNIDVGQSHFRREWCELISPDMVPDDAKRCRGYDFAASQVSEVNKNPDFTCGVLMSRDRFGTYYVEDMVEYRERPHTVMANVIKQSELDGKHVPIIIPKDSGAGGAIAAAHYVTTLSEAGCIVKTDVMSGHSNKLNKGLPFCQIAEAGNVKVVKGEWNERYFEVMEAFLGTPETLRKIHDDKHMCRQ